MGRIGGRITEVVEDLVRTGGTTRAMAAMIMMEFSNRMSVLGAFALVLAPLGVNPILNGSRDLPQTPIKIIMEIMEEVGCGNGVAFYMVLTSDLIPLITGSQTLPATQGLNNNGVRGKNTKQVNSLFAITMPSTLLIK